MIVIRLILFIFAIMSAMLTVIKENAYHSCKNHFLTNKICINKCFRFNRNSNGFLGHAVYATVHA